MRSKPPAALLFDMDGLLLDSERVARDAFLDVTAPHGVAADKAEAFFLTLVGTSHRETEAQVRDFLPGIDFAQFSTDWSLACSVRYDVEVPLKPGVREILPALAAQGHRMAVVTSTRGARARSHLRHAGLLDLFERVTAGDEVSANKPDPAPYLETAAALGVAPQDCAAFEDSDRGTLSAVRAGCQVTQIPDLRPVGLELPALGQHVARDLSEAIARMGLGAAA